MSFNSQPSGGAYPDAPPDFSTIAPASGASGAGHEEPPSYHEKREDPEELLHPIDYVMHGRFIYTSTNESTPLYELSRVIHAQGLAATNIEFHRLQYRVRTGQDGVPNVTNREKYLYNLHHGPYIFNEFAECALHTKSKNALGRHIVLKRSPFPHSGFRACYGTEAEGGRGPKRPRNEYFFWVKTDKKAGGFQWYDSAGRLVATQIEAGAEKGQPEYFLKVQQAMTRRMVEGLLALWSLWLWHQHASNVIVRKGKLAEVKEFMQKPRGDVPRLFP